MYAASYGHSNVVSILLKSGAEVDIENSKGETAITLAEGKGHDNIVSLLKIYSKN